ncbi:DNA-binding response regulator [Listeria floridensis FSL S10-1187]|uniref:Heme response regulator HssR n=1 Tax=Listeria floridensis FSL S10-1187 TaxID=1265817 RepID=A0ABN0REC0_9LIST|nr:response regulator transcription factor [Listeria floridensis]EUJ30992.1 DNA-binding response regulator [Listeria floridensis FSL S10-1187]
MSKILIADDDEAIRKLVGHYITAEGHTPVYAEDGAAAITQMEKEQVALAIVDLMMPKQDGFTVSRHIRKFYDIPIIMLTAKNQLADKEMGFSAGTDDYLTKPFEPEELIFRMRALLRRFHEASEKTVTAGKLVIDKTSYTVKSGKKEWIIPVKEFELLYTLASYPDRIFTREELIERIWGQDYDGLDRTVDVHIKRLRSRFDVTYGIEIVTVRGVGYKLEVVS